MIASHIGSPPGAALAVVFAHIYMDFIEMKGAYDAITKGEKEWAEQNCSKSIFRALKKAE